MSCIAPAPIDRTALDGAFHTFIADDESQHCARWCAKRRDYF